MTLSDGSLTLILGIVDEEDDIDEDELVSFFLPQAERPIIIKSSTAIILIFLVFISFLV
ncbi:hypothetical protein OfM2_13610 [Lactovum odontotermitis]